MMSGQRSLTVAVSALLLFAGTALAQPPGATPPPASSSRAVTQGFSVVLVLADLQGTATQDDVPPAARRALADMKDFLPYKSYKLIDAAWILGHGSGGTVTRLRGPEDQDYELRLYTNPARRGLEHPSGDAGQVVVNFTLSEAGRETESAALATVLVDQAQTQNEIARLEQQISARRREIGAADDAVIRSLQQELTAARNRLTSARSARSRAQPTTKITSPRSRAIIQTSFSMDAGETVVVGTSRLKGNTRALIALLTAVPPRSSRLPQD
jgi:hypothetical protein